MKPYSQRYVYARYERGEIDRIPGDKRIEVGISLLSVIKAILAIRKLPISTLDRFLCMLYASRLYILCLPMIALIMWALYKLHIMLNH